jgi:hypothetical protein
MKKNKILCILILTSLPALIFGADESGYLSVTTGDSMTIYVDTTYVGSGSVSFLELPVGSYTVHTYNPKDRSWSNRGRTEDIVIKSNDHIQLDFTKGEDVKIISLPYASNVYLGEEYLGQTPLIYPRENIGARSLRIENRGFEDKTFRLVQGENIYKISLQSSPNQKRSRVERIKDNQYQIKWYREGLVVTSLVASWASFYYKREADKYYNQYQRSSDSREMIALYSKTNRYDTMSEIAIAVSATTLGTYLFLLLIN